MRCPKCQDQQLKPAKLTTTLPSFFCAKCQGHLVEILSYRAWAENRQTQTIKACIPHTDDSKKSLSCPQCNTLMIKYRITGEIDNRIDLCANCGRFWLDNGEWALLSCLDLTAEIISVFSEPWQKAIKQDMFDMAYEDKFKSILGQDDYIRLKELKRWIDQHPERDNMLYYINNLSRNT